MWMGADCVVADHSSTDCVVQVPPEHPSLRDHGPAGQLDSADVSVLTLRGLCLLVRCRAKRIEGAAHEQVPVVPRSMSALAQSSTPSKQD